VPKHVLFICKSCNSVHSDKVDYEKSEGATLLNQLRNLHQNGSHQNELEIKPVGCLWTCDRPCSAAFSATDKATYLFTHVPATAAAALLQFGELYRNSQNGDIPGQQCPEALQSAQVAKIPYKISSPENSGGDGEGNA
jgi:predicted metal-binding protein